MATTANNRNASATPAANAWDNKELGCMWKKEKQSSKEKYLTGVLNLKNIPGFPDTDVPVVVFSNKRKSKDTHPDLRIYLSERKGTTDTKTAAIPAATTNRKTPEPAYVPEPAADANELI